METNGNKYHSLNEEINVSRFRSFTLNSQVRIQEKASSIMIRLRNKANSVKQFIGLFSHFWDLPLILI